MPAATVTMIAIRRNSPANCDSLVTANELNKAPATAPGIMLPKAVGRLRSSTPNHLADNPVHALASMGAPSPMTTVPVT